MQERCHESGSCVQKNCASLGVHPILFSPTSVQFKGEISGEFSCKRYQRQHLEFSAVYFGTRRSKVQILSPRPLLLCFMKVAAYWCEPRVSLFPNFVPT